ncbi:hypothetical protein BC827DRAFT_1157441 [Russula dissimulans]|nr:hypothetical protein BC827DRAFT_1157441 [Russula dissimulans]
MAVRTLKAKYEAKDDSTGLQIVRRVICVSKNQGSYYVPPEAATPSPAPVAAAPAVVTPPHVPTAAAGPATSIEDASIRAVDVLAAIVSQKLKRQLDEFPLSEFIEDLSNGKPTLQNEYATGLASRAIGGKMPGGFNISSAKAHLSKAWGLGPQRADTALPVATTMGRSKRLGFEAESQAWFDAAGQVRDPLRASSAELQARLDNVGREHGDTYIDGIQPVFDPLKACLFESSWSWVRQDALIFYDVLFGRLRTVGREITARCIAIMNRADPDLREVYGVMDNRRGPAKGETYAAAKKSGHELLEYYRGVVGRPPLYKDVTSPTAPHTEISEKGEIVCSEVNREKLHKLEAYVEEMCSADQISGSVKILKIQDDVVKPWNVVKSRPEMSEEEKNRIKALYDGVVRWLRKVPDNRPRPGVPRTRPSSSYITSVSADEIPLLHRKRRIGTQWEYDTNLSGVYFGVLDKIATSGSTRTMIEYYQGIVQRFSTRGSALTVVSFNQGSNQDVEALVYYIYMTLGLNLDYIITFAAVPESGREIDGLDESELAHLMDFLTTMALIPTLRSPLNRPLTAGLRCLVGAVIGWIRGTGLMGQSNMAAQEIETRGVRTFSAKEMAFNILGLMHPILSSITQVGVA